MNKKRARSDPGFAFYWIQVPSNKEAALVEGGLGV